MSKKASKFQEKYMAMIYRGKEIFKPLNTGVIDKHVKCVREFVADIFFYTKNGQTIMIDAGYNYERLKEKMEWLDLNSENIKDILVAHQDTDHVYTENDIVKNHQTHCGSRFSSPFIVPSILFVIILQTYPKAMVRRYDATILLTALSVPKSAEIFLEKMVFPHDWLSEVLPLQYS